MWHIQYKNHRQNFLHFENITTYTNNCVDAYINNLTQVNIEIRSLISDYKFLLTVVWWSDDSAIKMSNRERIVSLLEGEKVIDHSQARFLKTRYNFHLFLTTLHVRLISREVGEIVDPDQDTKY